MFAPNRQAAPSLSADFLGAAKRRLAVAATQRESLYEFIPRITPGFTPPRHLAPLVEELERADREPVRIVCHAPPRHGKTETVLRAIALYLVRNPRKVCGYATYGADLSYSKSRVARGLARDAGVELAPDAQGVKEWRTRAGGGLLATGVGGPFTGFGVNVLFVDDPFKNRIEAESAVARQRVIDWWRDVAFTRIEPGGSAIVFATRWHPEDLSGHLLKQGWKYLRLPAVADDGVALWPERYNLTALDEIRRIVGEYTWASLYQGLPRPRGGTVFNAEPKLYTAEALAEVMRSVKGWRKGIGADFAYSKRTSADHSVAVPMLGATVEGQRLTYVLGVLRRQQELPVFAAEAGRLQQSHGNCSALAYVSAIEREVWKLAGQYGFRVTTKLAQADKFTRAQPYAASWNNGRVLLPADGGPEIDTFLAEHLVFTGADGEDDDQVDAGAAGHDLVNSASYASPVTVAPSMTLSNIDDRPAGW